METKCKRYNFIKDTRNITCHNNRLLFTIQYKSLSISRPKIHTHSASYTLIQLYNYPNIQ